MNRVNKKTSKAKDLAKAADQSSAGDHQKASKFVRRIIVQLV
jgi:hypothetical protein